MKSIKADIFCCHKAHDEMGALSQLGAHDFTGLRTILLTQHCAGDKIEKNEMGWACGAYG